MKGGLDSQGGQQDEPELDISLLQTEIHTQIEGVQFEPVFSEPIMIEPTYIEGPSTQLSYIEPAFTEPTFTKPTYIEIPQSQASPAHDHTP